jgi:prevent-host-death family protein
MRTVTIDEASRQFDQLLAKVISGEDEILIARDGTPVARLSAVPAIHARRVPGCDSGRFIVPQEFFDPLPDEVVDAFYR